MDERRAYPAGCRRWRGWDLAAASAVVLACSMAYFWAVGRGGVPFFSKSPSGYYGLLTSGFRKGHLYADIAPDPALLALKDPYDPVANAPYRVHDMVLWGGHYYLYHGVTPVLVFFWPIAAISGWYPSEPFAVACFCCFGLAAAAMVLTAVRRRFCPEAPLGVLVAGALCAGLASSFPLLAASSEFYEVPIACAAWLLMLEFGALHLSFSAERHAFAWLGAASLSLGLAMGARPDYFLGGTGLLLAFAFHARRRTGGLGWLRWALAAFGPAFVCGVGLLLYNRARFGSLVEFGMHYQLAGASFVHQRLLLGGEIRRGLVRYLFSDGYWERYFPFFLPPGGEAFGVARYVPWCWFALAIPWVCWSRRRRAHDAFGVLAGVVAIGSIANLLVLSSFFFHAGRYMADYSPGFLLLGGIGALGATGALSNCKVAGRLVAVGAGIAAAVSVFVGLSAFVAPLPRTGALFRLSRTLDRPVAWWERANHMELGGLRMKVRLPAGRTGAVEPLFETGVAPDARDWLQIAYLPGRRARVGLFHAGLGLVASRSFAIPENRVIELETTCGSLLPPFEHPVFEGWEPGDYERLSRDLQVRVNGVEVLRAAVACYPTPPGYLRIGQKRWPGDGVADRFTGSVLSVQRLRIEREHTPVSPPGEGPLEITVLFPADRFSGSEPLVASGRGGQSDLLICTYDGPGRLRFAFDHADVEGPSGDMATFDPTRPCHLRVWMSSFGGSRAGEHSSPGRGVVWMDGSVVLNEEHAFGRPGSTPVSVGLNPFPSTVISRRFSGLVLGLSRDRAVGEVPPIPYADQFGAVEAEVLFPANAVAGSEPLVVTGAPGAGDLVYVKYLDSRHVAFGFDHWGVGGAVSRPMEADPGRPHRLDITLGSLYPPGEAKGWARRLRVAMDGNVAIDQAVDAYPTRREDILIGRNRIGGSTCGEFFTGRILELKRPARPAP